MKENTYYAVVDLEATGNQFNQGNRVIQFGCTLIQNGEIIETIDISINPERNIPMNIERLTGISNKMVKKSPLFYEVANYIRGLLADTIFVAHNANFDYTLLNEEFKRAGVPLLRCDVIDTVDLSRILLLRQESFTLSDLSQALGLTLNEAHDASDDSYATAELLLHLNETAKHLPKVTLDKLNEITKILNFQTHTFFEDILAVYDEQWVNSDDYVVVDGIALKKEQNQVVYNYRQERIYPHSNDEKTHLYQDKYQSRPTQEKMMDLVYDTFSSESKEHIAIEAVAGAGKSMGYLLPLFYLASPDNQAIISTYTTTLQQQLLEKDIAELREMTDFDLPIGLVKGRSHYIDLEQFHYSISEGPMDKSRAIYLGKILVWLTETMTGDMDEIFTNVQRLPILSEIRTLKTSEMLQASKWAPYQFYLRALKKIENAAIVITNHAYFVQDTKQETKQLPQAKYVIIDESHHLPDIVQESSRKYFSSHEFKELINQYQKKFADKFTVFIEKSDDEDLKYLNGLINSNLTYLMFELPNWEQQMIDNLAKKSLNELVAVSVYSDDLLSRTKRQTQKWLNILNEMTQQSIQTIQILENQFALFNPAERTLVDAWFEFIENIYEQNVALQELVRRFNKPNHQIWVSMWRDNKDQYMSIETYDSEETERFSEFMGSIDHVLYTSGTLSVPQLDNLYEKQIDTEPIDEYHLPSPYDYADQTRVFVPEDIPSIKEVSVEAYDMWSADAIKQIAKQMDKPMLVLFNSLRSLEAVYQNLRTFEELSDRQILAQNISGTKHRILKMFSRSDNAILLGADTFWEGIDLPGSSLEVIIMTHLPFESPERPAVKSRQERLKELKKNPFVYDALPRAQLKFRQGFGRLIRSTTDKGILFVFDNRFIEANYAKGFQNILPEGTPIEQVDLWQLNNFDDYFSDE